VTNEAGEERKLISTWTSSSASKETGKYNKSQDKAKRLVRRQLTETVYWMVCACSLCQQFSCCWCPSDQDQVKRMDNRTSMQAINPSFNHRVHRHQFKMMKEPVRCLDLACLFTPSLTIYVITRHFPRKPISLHTQAFSSPSPSLCFCFVSLPCTAQPVRMHNLMFLASTRSSEFF
jgi:hypothetical protein